LEEAGWRPAPHRPALTEPLANTIGAFSEGKNATHMGPRDGRRYPTPGKMFRESGLFERIREAILDEAGKKVAWTMIADLGGYTADFAMLGIVLEGDLSDLDGQYEGKKRLATHSDAIGIADLDRRICKLLSPEKAAAIDEMGRDPDQHRLETFHRAVYA